jgi:hypothetical protein
MEALRNMKLPPGFGFYPSDTELIGHYLKRKILGQKIEHNLIPEVDIYKHEPWDLPVDHASIVFSWVHRELWRFLYKISSINWF